MFLMTESVLEQHQSYMKPGERAILSNTYHQTKFDTYKTHCAQGGETPMRLTNDEGTALAQAEIVLNPLAAVIVVTPLALLPGILGSAHSSCYDSSAAFEKKL